MTKYQESLENLVGQARATARLHANRPIASELNGIVAHLLRLRDPDVAERVARRPVERTARAAA